MGLHRAGRGLWILLALALSACSTPVRLSAVPVEDEARAIVPGMPNVRYTTQADVERLIGDAVEGFRREEAFWEASGNTGPLPTAEFLAISGGGENGAFGAGLLVGWTAAGTRPEFKLVTGVSTGALTAPFAFLGPDWDDELTEVYTTIDASDVLERRGILAAVTNDAMADNAPLHRLVAGYADERMMRAIAEEYAKGRFLMVGTTNLDARRPTLWNLGEIAKIGTPEALALLQDILVASAAIPGAFPPTLIDVEVDGQPYQEMHVDGGASAQVFVYPPVLHAADLSRELRVERERRAWVIRNARLDPDWADVERRTMSIVSRAITSLIQTQGVGDLYRIYLTTQRDGVDFNLAYIPASFDLQLEEPFDTAYMKALYDLGYELARAGYQWEKVPPGFGAPTEVTGSIE
jgi:predicted acylesterase/phospholipase RssA